MDVHFDQPWLLLLLPCFLLILWHHWKRDHRLTGVRKKFVFILRSGLVVMLVLAAAGWHTVQKNERMHMIYVVDRSDSMRAEQAAADWINEAETYKRDGDHSGLVTFATGAVTEYMTDPRPLDIVRFAGSADGRQTDIENALLHASRLIPDGESGRIVLLTDGRENKGNWRNYATLPAGVNVPVDVVDIGQEGTVIQDASLERLHMPASLREGEAFTLEVTAASTISQTGVLRVYENNTEIFTRDIALSPGENRYVLELVADQAGFHRYRAQLYVDGDAEPSNDRAFAYANVSGPPRVLLIERQGNGEGGIGNILSAAGITFDRVLPEMIASGLESWIQYDSVIVDNVSAQELGEEKMEQLEQAVRDYGTGLVMIGGEHAYGLGNYFDTSLEKALPVYMDLRGERQLPSLALIVVMDRSGSMSGEPLRLAKQSALATANLLREQDTIGVLAFDTNPVWIVEPEQRLAAEAIEQQILSIAEGGGTEIYPAVEEAFRRLAEVDAKRKHIILLTDGHSASTSNYDPLLRSIQDERITLSSVAIGDGADRALLEYLATGTGGRMYDVHDEQSLPAIVSRETIMASRTYIVDEPFVPALGQGSDWMKYFVDGVPDVRTHIATTPKETAEVVLYGPKDDPLLARWQYGAGRAVAWTSDLSGDWSGAWSAWERTPELFGAIIAWTFPQFSGTPLQLDARPSGNGTQLQLAHPDPSWSGELEAIVTGEDGQTATVEFEPVRPGLYTAFLPDSSPGVYLARIDRHDAEADGSFVSQVSGFVIPYSREYSLTASEVRLHELAELTGGRQLVMERPDEVYDIPAETVRERSPLTGMLLCLSLVLWLTDIAVRRFGIPTWSRWSAPVSDSSPRMPAAVSVRTRPERSPSAVPSAVPTSERSSTLDNQVAADERAATSSGKRSLSGTVRHIDSGNDVGGTQPNIGESTAGEDRMNRLLAAKKRRSGKK